MAEKQTSGALHNNRLTSKEIGAARRSFPRQKGCADTYANGAARVHAAVHHFHHQEFAAEETVAIERMKDGAS